jgi:hypothetical protein
MDIEEKIIRVFLNLLFIGGVILAGWLLIYALKFQYNEGVIVDSKYVKQYSYELKGITNEEYQYNTSNAKYIKFFAIAYGKYSSTTNYVEYYILWQQTSKGTENVKIENKNVYFIEDDEQNPRIEKFIKRTVNKNGVKNRNENDFYYQIYIPKNTIIYEYEID